jgi:transposase InsO family protein
MAAATGVPMNAKYILPFNPHYKSIASLHYQSKLSSKAASKLKAYQIYKMKKLTMTDIAQIFDVNKSTISRWIKQSKTAMKIRRYQYLEPKSRSPINITRTKVIDNRIRQIILDIRRKYKCGKDNISRYLLRDYHIKIHSSTIHRFLNKLHQIDDPKYTDKNKKRIKWTKKRSKFLVRIKDVVDKLEHRAFERFQIDTKYWGVFSHTFYVVTAVDVVTRMMFARTYSRHTAVCARDFLSRLDYLYRIRSTTAYIQRDNGSEFMGEFEEAANEYDITLVTNYVRRPQMNAYVERFNGTLKSELLEYVMPDTVREANEYLQEYTIRYNFERIHGQIGNITPFEKYCELKFKKPIDQLILNSSGLLHIY